MTGTVVRTISAADHLAFVRSRRGVSFLQTPAWAEVKSEWRSESVGWFRGQTQVGAGLVLYRQLPVLPRSLAYLPEGPDLDWDEPGVEAALDALVAHVRRRGAFAVRIGPPVVTRVWESETIKKAIADDSRRRLTDAPPDVRSDLGAALVDMLRRNGWRAQASDHGFAAGQPQYVFQLPLAGRTEDDVLAGMNQLWRRNIKKAEKSGVKVEVGSASDLPAFHALYVETARRDGFTPRPLGYFEQMVRAMTAEDPDRIRLYLAHHDGDLVAATTMVRLNEHAWYSYGASSTAKREVRGSNAVQWAMIRDAIAAGADVYDLRGITDTVAADDPHIGLIQFKVGTGGRAVEYVGEWERPINRALTKAFQLYLSRR